MGTHARARYVVAASACGIAAMAGCSSAAAHPSAVANQPSASANGQVASGTPAAQASPAGAQPASTGGAVAPLTGLTVSAATAQRPAVAVAISGSDPIGLGSADFIFEEMTSPIRYLAVFQSAQASRVGPVTATRPMDGQALSVLHPVTGYDGGTSSFISVLDASKDSRCQLRQTRVGLRFGIGRSDRLDLSAGLGQRIGRTAARAAALPDRGDVPGFDG